MVAEFQRLAANADGDEAQAATLRGSDEFARMVRVAIDHRDTAVAHEPAKQTELGLEVVLEGLVIVQMIARDVGEGCGGHIDAVETELIDSVAGGFQRETSTPSCFSRAS